MGTLLQQIFGTTEGTKLDSNPIVQTVEGSLLTQIQAESPTLGSIISLAGLFTNVPPANPAAIVTAANWPQFQAAIDATLQGFGAPATDDPQFEAALAANLAKVGITVPSPPPTTG